MELVVRLQNKKEWLEITKKRASKTNKAKSSLFISFTLKALRPKL